MAPGRPSPITHFANGHAANGRHQRRRRLDRQQPAEIHGLPEYLYNAYMQLAFTGAYGRELPLLIDADSGEEITYRSFQQSAAVLSRNLELQCGLEAYDTVAILAFSNIDIPIATVAAWNVRANVVVLPPEAPVGELQAMLVQHMPRVIFVSSGLLDRAQQLLSGLSNSRRVRIVLLDIDSSTAPNDMPPSIHQLYTSNLNEAPIERQPLSLNEAQELTAVIYFNHQVGEDGTTLVDANSMSHYSVISFYNSSLRRSPSLPSTASRPANPESNRPQTPVSPTSRANLIQASLDHTPDIAFTVLRMHRAYRLHRVLFDMFCRGARYIVAHSFDPAQFVSLVDQYELLFAELTFAEIAQLVAFMQTRTVPRLSLESEADSQVSVSQATASSLDPELSDTLASLRIIYTESDRAELELGAEISRLLPNATIVRTRFGSYVESPVRSRT
ncbi:hypothetical protein LPJ78_002395 [Coemansia sp. RSA 989]|nr:hypothetical protein BX667DRAFT_205299 [Coemansia mojavensis]KAJ1742412.1 hypothetical protein LPJ68_001921 [Coemansia sp. RSA 1086]KAJ1752775.1 hypothetical protein LPJ79_000911 [Coemansia sp. RSA 1821]KAJ1865802.1 hypothetical protein LPJ78_002395 [Coemansia sp. RSA 989]KAJ1875187.1 hypothetical protein LPJ55_000859 [Coemansia sp. RSA 990]KAJ2631285.1 hypothetical protein H4R22_002091 [Coemansia sp. RSA 1290]KAJ2650585.1 hypothetical protein IWW40_002322 [Coemansia sp. RSA 1250]KAJ26718